MENYQEKLSLVQDLIQLSEVDGNVDFMEKNFIQTIAQGLGITTEEINQLKEHSIPFTPEEKEIDRITHFYRLILLMGVDSEHHKKEIQFCNEVGLKMGLNPIAMREVIERVLKSETKTLLPQEIIEIFKTYHS
jgi:uncharacterized tellurite resistance protein B-like protein